MSDLVDPIVALTSLSDGAPSTTDKFSHLNGTGPTNRTRLGVVQGGFRYWSKPLVLRRSVSMTFAGSLESANARGEGTTMTIHIRAQSETSIRAIGLSGFTMECILFAKPVTWRVHELPKCRRMNGNGP